MLCLGISSVEVPFLIQIALLVDFTPKCICMVNDYRVFLDVDLICIVDATVGPTVAFHFMPFIPIESSYI
jgi:hypothetical protein